MLENKCLFDTFYATSELVKMRKLVQLILFYKGKYIVLLAMIYFQFVLLLFTKSQKTEEIVRYVWQEWGKN